MPDIFNYNSSSSDELQQFIKVNKHLSLASLKPHIEDAETQFLLQLGINADLYETIKAVTNADVTILQKIRKQTQKVVANYALYLYLQHNGFAVGDNANSTEETQIPSDTLFKTQLYATLRKSYEALEYLVYELLLPNRLLLGQFNTNFVKEFFLNSPKVFVDYQYLRPQGSLEVYMSLLPYMRKVEKYVIKPILCKDLFDSLKTAHQNDLLSITTISPIYLELLEMVREVAADETIKMASPFLGNLLTVNGHKSKNRLNEQNASSESMNDIHFELRKSTSKSVRALIEFLVINIAEFTDWETCEMNPNFTPEIAEIETKKSTICSNSSSIII